MTGSATDVCRTFGVVFEDVSCEQVASKTLRAAYTWGGVAALFVDEAGTARAVCVGTPECDRRMRYQVAHLVGVYTCTCNSGGANRDARARLAEDVFHHMEQRTFIDGVLV